MRQSSGWIPASAGMTAMILPEPNAGLPESTLRTGDQRIKKASGCSNTKAGERDSNRKGRLINTSLWSFMSLRIRLTSICSRM